jgi:hypothetical protein
LGVIPTRDRSFTVLRRYGGFVLALAVGSVAGAFIGGQMLGIVKHVTKGTRC